MAKFTFNMPDIGEGIAEAEIVQWHKQVGDQISEDEEFVDMMTDKATVPMESPVNGKILEIAGGEGDMVSIGSMLVVIEVEGEVPDDVAEKAALPRRHRHRRPPPRRNRSRNGSRSRLPMRRTRMMRWQPIPIRHRSPNRARHPNPPHRPRCSLLRQCASAPRIWVSISRR